MTSPTFLISQNPIIYNGRTGFQPVLARAGCPCYRLRLLGGNLNGGRRGSDPLEIPYKDLVEPRIIILKFLLQTRQQMGTGYVSQGI